MPIPYLHFTDSCRDAMTFYQDILGGTLDVMGFDQMPDAPPEMAGSDRVMHATLTTEQGVLFASDSFPGEEAAPQAGVSISWGAADHDSGKALFERFLDGGDVVMPYEATFFSPGFGMVKDRFGTHWMIMVDPEQG